MAAPTPVSALVHSSTLVTAGVYLILRLKSILGPPSGLELLGRVGAITILIASLRAIVEADIKKIIALSTLSQLGVIIRAARLKARTVLFFHLARHAFFKALLFIGAGDLIHNSNDYQELRYTGAASNTLPVTRSLVLICKASLCGLPFFSAFFSKEIVLEALAMGGAAPLVTYLLIWLGVALTRLYTFRFLYYVFIRASRAPALSIKCNVDQGV